MAKIEVGTRLRALKTSHSYTAGNIYVVCEDNGLRYVVDDEWRRDDISLDNIGMFEMVSEETPESPSPNMVESPPHYTNARFETIEIIEEITAGYSDGFVAYSVGNALKYLARAPFKHDDGGSEDLRKAAKYLEFAIKRIEADQAK
jgi:hypothetical protein